MAYFQMIWTQTGGENPFNGENILTQTETSGPFSSPLNLRQKVIPYPPTDYLLSFTYNSTYSTANLNWNAPPVPTPYEVNPLSYSWNLYNSTLSLLIDSGTTNTTTDTSVLGNSSYIFMVYTLSTLNYASNYFYIFANSTGGGGTSSNSQSAPVQYFPLVMPTPSITFFSTFLQSSIYTLDLEFSFETPPAPALIASTLFTLGLFSNLTDTEPYIPCSTLGYFQQVQSPTYNPPNYAFNLSYDLNSVSPQLLDFTILSGFYYKIAVVASDMLGNVSDSSISQQSPFQFYNPIVETPSDSSFIVFSADKFSNVQIVSPYVQYPTVNLTNITYNWILYTSPNDTTYVSTTNTGNFPAFAGGLSTTIQTLLIGTPILGDAYYKLYVNASAALNVAQPSSYFSSLTGIYAPPAIAAPSISSFSMVGLSSFSLEFSVTSLPMANTGWAWSLYSNTFATGNFSSANRSGIFPLISADSISTPTYSPLTTSGTRPYYGFYTGTTIEIGGGTPLTDNTWYKLALQGIGSNGTRFVDSIIFPPCLIGVSTVSDASLVPAVL